ncbi:MAG: hypothetical protein RLZZ283_487 [Candidatus Parcubacteria bacterium]|jgi:uncharacterized membrane protein YobD (UPF0266 family)
MGMETFDTQTPEKQRRARAALLNIRLSREAKLECLYGIRSILVILFVVAAAMVAGGVSGAWLLSPLALTAWAATGAVSFVVSLIFEYAIKASE